MKTSLLLCGVLALTLLVTGGCRRDRVTPSSVRRNPTPELQSMAHNSQQRKNIHARVHDTNFRQVWDDLDRLLLMDRPSRMTFYPVP